MAPQALISTERSWRVFGDARGRELIHRFLFKILLAPRAVLEWMFLGNRRATTTQLRQTPNLCKITVRPHALDVLTVLSRKKSPPTSGFFVVRNRIFQTFGNNSQIGAAETFFFTILSSFLAARVFAANCFV